MFTLSVEEWSALMLSQIATTSQRRRRLDRLPRAFTEHGCLMLANVLRSKRAVEVSLLVVRAFVRLRTAIAANRHLAARVDKLSRELGKHGRKLSAHERKLLDDIRRRSKRALPAVPPNPSTRKR